MQDHLDLKPFAELIEQNETIVFPSENFNIRASVGGKIRYWWCWVAAAILLLFVGAPSLPVLWIINRRRKLYPIAIWGARTWLKACGARVEVRGLENLEAGRNYVFVSNHRSYLDTAALFGHMPRRMGLVAKQELLKVPIMGQGMSFVNIIAIDRSNPERARESMEAARKVMEDNYSFGVFAEGTRALPGQLLPFKKGAFHLAMQTKAAVVPVAIKNTDCMMGKGQGTAYPGTIEMVIMPPIEICGPAATESDLTELLRESRARIADCLATK
jgi:1-acyl-sn-glycerol-3-phosphate acyltransferase